MRGRILVAICLALWLPAATACGQSPESAEDSGLRERIRSMYGEIRTQKLGPVADLEPAALLAFTDSVEVLIVDVRSRRERHVSMLPGSVTVDEFRALYDPRRPQPVVAFCTIGQRSGFFARTLRERGVEAYNLAGGILLWVAEGGTVVDGRSGEPTRRVHVYGTRWNLLPSGYEAVW